MDAVKCEECGKFAERPSVRGGLGGPMNAGLPVGWLRVIAVFGRGAETKPDTHGGYDLDGEFCGRACIAAQYGRAA